MKEKLCSRYTLRQLQYQICDVFHQCSAITLLFRTAVHRTDSSADTMLKQGAWSRACIPSSQSCTITWKFAGSDS